MTVKKQKSVWGIALKAGTIQATQVFGSRKEAEDAIAKISHLSNGFEAVELGPVNSPELPDGWIPCAERMPAPYAPVLFYAAGAHGGVDCCASTYNGFHSGSRWLQDGTLTHHDSSPPVRNEIVVTHWQPIPAPPTTEK